jgi:hypothetical protein
MIQKDEEEEKEEKGEGEGENPVICRKMDGTGDLHVKQNKPDL